MARHYELLGIPRIASAERVKRSYRNLVKIYHPDRFPSGSKAHAEAEKRIREINIAYGVLSKPKAALIMTRHCRSRPFRVRGPNRNAAPAAENRPATGTPLEKAASATRAATEPSGLLLDRDAPREFPSHIVRWVKQAFRPAMQLSLAMASARGTSAAEAALTKPAYCSAEALPHPI
jgi:curved DNA-binding protein CbpA